MSKAWLYTSIWLLIIQYDMSSGNSTSPKQVLYISYIKSLRQIGSNQLLITEAHFPPVLSILRCGYSLVCQFSCSSLVIPLTNNSSRNGIARYWLSDAILMRRLLPENTVESNVNPYLIATPINLLKLLCLSHSVPLQDVWKEITELERHLLIFFKPIFTNEIFLTSPGPSKICKQ